MPRCDLMNYDENHWSGQRAVADLPRISLAWHWLNIRAAIRWNETCWGCTCKNGWIVLFHIENRPTCWLYARLLLFPAIQEGMNTTWVWICCGISMIPTPVRHKYGNLHPPKKFQTLWVRPLWHKISGLSGLHHIPVAEIPCCERYCGIVSGFVLRVCIRMTSVLIKSWKDR